MPSTIQSNQPEYRHFAIVQSPESVPSPCSMLESMPWKEICILHPLWPSVTTPIRRRHLLESTAESVLDSLGIAQGRVVRPRSLATQPAIDSGNTTLPYVLNSQRPSPLSTKDTSRNNPPGTTTATSTTRHSEPSSMQERVLLTRSLAISRTKAIGTLRL